MSLEFARIVGQSLPLWINRSPRDATNELAPRALRPGDRVRLEPQSDLWRRHYDMRAQVGTVLAVSFDRRVRAIVTVAFENDERLVGIRADSVRRL